jgi:molybdopterin molybdotransferase
MSPVASGGSSACPNAAQAAARPQGRATPATSGRMAWAHARAAAHTAPRPLPATDMTLAAAAGLTLAEPIRALVARPAFDTAAMDGYAVAGTGTGPWSLVGHVRAGQVWGRPLIPGEAVEISTGAQVPDGASAVLPVEAGVKAHRQVFGMLPERDHIRRIGEDTPAGELMAPAGHPVTPAMIGLAASCGHDTLSVRPRPRVRVLITGDELLHSGPSGHGRVRDALGPLLPSLIDHLGGHTSEVRFVPDEPRGLLAETLTRPADETAGVDVDVITGSTSVGVSDQLRRYLNQPGITWLVDTVACRPGHPQLLAALGNGRYLVGLPGNPYAAYVAAHTLLGPLLAGLTGRPLPSLPLVPVTGPVKAADGITRLVPVTWDGDSARVLDRHRAADLHGAALATALVAITPTWTNGAPAQLIITG